MWIPDRDLLIDSEILWFFRWADKILNKMSDKEDYLTCYREFFEEFAETVRPEDQLPVNIAGYTITEAELPGEVLYWTTQYLTEK